MVQKSIFIATLLVATLGLQARGLQQSPNYSLDLHAAIIEKDIDAARRLIETGKADVNQQNCFVTMLHEAVDLEHEEMIQYLCERGANVDTLDHAGRTPLLIAVLRKNIGAVRILTAWGANPNIADTRGRTPVYLTFFSGADDHKDILRTLLEHGANVNHATHDGDTPLSRAAEHRSRDNVVTLLQHGADVHTPNDKGITPLHGAVESGRHDNVATLLAAGAELNAFNKFGQTPLSRALVHRNRATIRAIHKHGNQDSGF